MDAQVEMGRAMSNTDDAIQLQEQVEKVVVIAAVIWCIVTTAISCSHWHWHMLSLSLLLLHAVLSLSHAGIVTASSKLHCVQSVIVLVGALPAALFGHSTKYVDTMNDIIWLLYH